MPVAEVDDRDSEDSFPFPFFAIYETVAISHYFSEALRQESLPSSFDGTSPLHLSVTASLFNS